MLSKKKEAVKATTLDQLVLEALVDLLTTGSNDEKLEAIKLYQTYKYTNTGKPFYWNHPITYNTTSGSYQVAANNENK